jgi:predicted dehydrogenase
MEQYVRWGVLSTAKIAWKKVLPGMIRECEHARVEAVASRNRAKADEMADDLGIPKRYGTYEELLADPEIDALYIPLPNHLHVEWSEKAMRAGKHVLCEKPLALDTDDVRRLMDVRGETGRKIGEAFMVDTHPQWAKTKELVSAPQFGTLKAAHYFVSYSNSDPENVRNAFPWREGGGGLWDIGCYAVHLSRYIFAEEPRRVIAAMEWNEELGIDQLSSGILEFSDGQSVFTCATRLLQWQRMSFYGTGGRVEVEVPLNQPPEDPSRIYLQDGSNLGRSWETVEIPPTDQYAAQADAFSLAVLEDREVPVPLENTLGNTAALLALFRSAESGRWETPETR